MTLNSVFTAAELDLIARALNARADIYARVAEMAGTVPDYEIATRATRRYRALANRVCAARNAAHNVPRTAPPSMPGFLLEGAPDPDGQHG
ncbi:hypothetical protein E1264_35140 [Actinomadura sp. KC216]|uniref:hypothetical protein n=1 Tax=Actinomadura sp. KC216 TaxID=2530370 RepID=UPI001048E3FC|nr:hypothetical protein [Actinomadura sp. KC216]TDB79712.1 hypothetical protein E1264_35140 [Actinomadura sp. KC216]